MKEIFLTKNKITWVSDEDFDNLIKHKWSYHKEGYASRKVGSSTVYMHRQILDATSETEVDHKNLNKLDNRRQNLRLATRAEQMWNRGKQKINTSGFKGVDNNKNRWRARIRVKGKRITLGNFNTAEEAAKAYEQATVKFHKIFARTEV